LLRLSFHAVLSYFTVASKPEKPKKTAAFQVVKAVEKKRKKLEKFWEEQLGRAEPSSKRYFV
jgi:hypothetical protein